MLAHLAFDGEAFHRLETDILCEGVIQPRTCSDANTVRNTLFKSLPGESDAKSLEELLYGDEGGTFQLLL